MASSTTVRPRASTGLLAVESAAGRVPWYIWCSVLAVTSAIIGGHWDISWHRSIGRDTFWTPAHIMIYLCGVLAGISCGYLILATTFGKLPGLRENSVALWGFRAPLGAFLSAWGGVAMLTSAPFDNWWHNAYGLDVKIVSPPHVLLITGMVAVEVGTLILILGAMNRAAGRYREVLNRLFVYTGGTVLVVLGVLIMEMTNHVQMHTAFFYRVVCTALPAVLVGVGRASRSRWGATAAAGVYSAFVVSMVWLLPLFPAEPKLGPVYYPVHHFMPPEFPLLILVPALALDLLWRRTESWGPWKQALVSGALFFGVFLAAQWAFADFLLSPASRNRIFGTGYHAYYEGPNWYTRRNLFLPAEAPARFAREMALALAAAILTTRVGMAWGSWMRRVRR